MAEQIHTSKRTIIIFNDLIRQEYIADMEEKDIQKETLKPITKVDSTLDKELQEWEVESTTGG
jgi:hypothetical protein